MLIGIIIGVVLGALAGIIIMALMVSSSYDEYKYNRKSMNDNYLMEISEEINPDADKNKSKQ